MKPWLLYSVIRLAIFAVVLTVLLVAQVPGWIAAIVAALFGFAVSYLFLGKLRAPVVQGVADRRSGRSQPATDDEDAEDALERNNFLEGDGPAQR